MPERDQPEGESAAGLSKQERVGGPLCLSERPASHRLGVVDGQDERLGRAELARLDELRSAPVFEQCGASPGGRQHRDAYLWEGREVDVPDLDARRGGGRRREREQRDDEGCERRALHAAPNQVAAARSTPFVLSFDRNPGRRLVGSSGATS